ncbi:MAG: DUF979 domain-containing protein [Asticcacaulis sp.]|uniref:DUF979 domain-containing protein n=1 Tax=Asticcacaulis sp. TaxID=1872648 RepID=UPI0039E5F0C3
MANLELLYVLLGGLFAAFALGNTRKRHFRSALFWGLYAATLIFGSIIPDFANGLLVIGMVILAAAGLKPAPSATTDDEERQRQSERIGNALFWPALIVPVTTLAGSLLMPDGKLYGLSLIAPKQVTLTFLAIGSFIGLALALFVTRSSPITAFGEGRRLADQVGWPMILPQMLAALGGIFALAGVGDVISQLIVSRFNITAPWEAVMLYAIGMALFTMIMGNAFAAFPVMTAGIGLPLIVKHFGGDPHIMCALGMLSGFCGTLMTPMAANFNLVPAAVLGLKDQYAVIKVQIPTVLCLLAGNIVIMTLFGFPK